MKTVPVLIVIVLLFFCSCTPAIKHPCLMAALEKAEQIEEKDKLLFVGGNYKGRLFARHVQLWILRENGHYEILTGQFYNKYHFRPTGDYYSYKGFIALVEKYGWLKTPSSP